MAKIGEMLRKVDAEDMVSFEGRLQSNRLPIFEITGDDRALVFGMWQYAVKRRGQRVGTMVFAGPEDCGRDLYEITLDPEKTGFASLIAVEAAPDVFDIYAQQRESLAA